MERVTHTINSLREAMRPTEPFGAYDIETIGKAADAATRAIQTFRDESFTVAQYDALLHAATQGGGTTFWWRNSGKANIKPEGMWVVFGKNEMPPELWARVYRLCVAYDSFVSEHATQYTKMKHPGCDPRWKSAQEWREILVRYLAALGKSVTELDRAYDEEGRKLLFQRACAQADDVEPMLSEASLRAYGGLTADVLAAMDQFVGLVRSDPSFARPVKGLLARCVYLTNEDRRAREERESHERHQRVVAALNEQADAARRQADAVEARAEAEMARAEAARRGPPDVYHTSYTDSLGVTHTKSSTTPPGCCGVIALAVVLAIPLAIAIGF